MASILARVFHLFKNVLTRWECTADLAKKLYVRYTGKDIGTLEPSTEKRKKEFFFTSLQLVQSGSQFALMEEALHEAIKDLPAAFENIAKGKEPNTNQIYTLGSPTNRMGKMSEKFLDEIKDGKAFEGFGELYAEFIEQNLEEGGAEEGRDEVLLYGESMAASFATGTAEHLLQDGAVTQSRSDAAEKNIPFLQVRLDMPVGSSGLSAARKRLQIPLGFLAQAVYTGATDSYIRGVMTKDKAFLESTERLFAEQGMKPEMSEEQIGLKKAGVKEAIYSLREGTPIPPDMKVTKVVGQFDPLLYSHKENMDATEHRNGREGTLGENMRKTGKHERTFSIKMTHAMPYFRQNEMKRMRRVAERLKALKGVQ